MFRGLCLAGNALLYCFLLLNKHSKHRIRVIVIKEGLESTYSTICRYRPSNGCPRIENGFFMFTLFIPALVKAFQLNIDLKRPFSAVLFYLQTMADKYQCRSGARQ
jgi:hypothetical protein